MGATVSRMTKSAHTRFTVGYIALYGISARGRGIEMRKTNKNTARDKKEKNRRRKNAYNSGSQTVLFTEPFRH